MATCTFKQLLGFLGHDSKNIDTNIDDFDLNYLQMDSRNIQKGDVFVAIKGTILDGQDFIAQAISAGARVILVETNKKSDNLTIDYIGKEKIPQIHIFKLAENLSVFADHFYHSPSKQLAVIGVTGTNGKTTITQLIIQLATLLNEKSAVLGTLGNGIYNQLKPSLNTTSSPVDIQSLLASFVEKKVKMVAMEISSHGLAMNRVKGVSCAATVFTNLSRDHLDYHKTMYNYAKAKWSLFTLDNKAKLVADSGKSIINYDDRYGKRWVEKLPQPTTVSSKINALNKIKKLGTPYLGVSAIEYHDKGACIHIESSWGNAVVHSPLLGEFNVSNLLLAVATLLTLDFPFFAVINMASYLKPICGRMEILHQKNTPTVIVDYAHTPDALYKALQASRIHCKGTLWVIFGCGGDRDSGKRPLMGEVAEQYADKIILTNDNPRTEDDISIINGIKIGLSNTTYLQIIPDREKAIATALKQASPDDVILIAGKGHEDYQIIGENKFHFSDQEIVRQLLKGVHKK